MQGMRGFFLLATKKLSRRAPKHTTDVSTFFWSQFHFCIYFLCLHDCEILSCEMANANVKMKKVNTMLFKVLKNCS